MRLKRKLSALLGRGIITVVDDERSREDKKKDWLATDHEKFCDAIGGHNTGDIDIWGFDRIEESVYADENQYGESSCVVHAVGSGTEVIGLPRPEKGLFYRKRSNYPCPGCVPHEMVHFASKHKLWPWEMCPTPRNATETYANSLPEVDFVLRKEPLAYYDVIKNNNSNSDNIAAASYLGCAVMITIYATVPEWRKEYVDIIDLSLTKEKATVRHEVLVLPKSGFKYKGKKYVAVVDSAHFGGYSLRYVSSDFLNKRVYSAYAFIK